MASNGNNVHPEIVMDEHYGCLRVNGVLCPEPISYMPWTPPPSPPPPQERARPSTKRTRGLTASIVLETGTVSMKLLQCIDDQMYVLELREVNHGNAIEKVNFYSLSPSVSSRTGKTRIRASANDYLGKKVMFPVTEEVFSDTGNMKYKLPIKDRLDGEWTYEVRQRTTSGKIEKFYYHGTVNKTIRSANDIATFVMYAK